MDSTVKRTRPFSITVISFILAVVGVIGLVRHLTQTDWQHPIQDDVLWVLLVELIAIVCGIFLFLGHNWARRLTVLWLGFHVAISFPQPGQFLFHAVLLVMIAYILFRRPEADYFRAD